MNASAARKPGLEARPAGVSEGVEEIGEVDRARLMFDGEIEFGSVAWLWEKFGEALSTENVDVFADFRPFGRDTERGRGASSREKIERSSPFHRSPHL